MSPQGGDGPLDRLEAIYAGRNTVVGRAARGPAAVSAAQLRLDQLAEYRRRMDDAARDSAVRRRGRAVRMAAGPAPGPNWISIGPAAVLEGQAVNRPVVSGRVPALAISSDGRRVYAATANGGVWASADAGRSWTPKSEELDLQEPVPTARTRVDSLACGAIGMVDGGRPDQDRLYVGTGEAFPFSPKFLGVGPLFSTNGGNSWTTEASNPSLVGEGFFELTVDPGDPDHVMGATTLGLYERTVTAGVATWRRQALGGVPGGPAVTSVVASHSGGTTTWFAAVENGQVVTATTTPGASPAAWAQLAAGWPAVATVGRMSLAVSAGSPATLYALVAQPEQPSPPPPLSPSILNGVYRIDLGDAAPRWRQVTGVPANLFGLPPASVQGFYDQAIVVDPADRNLFYVAGSFGQFGGSVHRCPVEPDPAGWKTTSVAIGESVHADVHHLALAPHDHRQLWVGCDGGVFMAADATRNGNDVFVSRNTGLSTMTLQGLDHPLALPGYLFGGAQDNGGLGYHGDEVWTHQQGGDGGDTVIAWSNPAPGPQGRILNGYVNGAFRTFTSDGGRYLRNERKVTLDPGVASPPAPVAVPAERTLFYPPIAGPPPDATPAHANRIAIGTQRVWISDDFGATLTSIPSGSWPGDRITTALARIQCLTFASHTRLYVGTTDGQLLRFDQGAAWAQLAPPPGRPPGVPGVALTSIAVDPAVPGGDAVYCTFGGTGGGHDRVWHWHATRATKWEPRGGLAAPPPPKRLLDIHHSKIVVHPTTPSTLYVAADLGVWHSTDSGATWEPFSNNLPDAAVFDLDLHPGVGTPPSGPVLRASTHGRGVFELPLTGTQPAVQLAIRTNAFDTGRHPAPAGIPDPLDTSRSLSVVESPDIRTDPPDRDGRLKLDPGQPVDFVQFKRDLPKAGVVLAGSGAGVATTRVYVRVANLGPGTADGVTVTLALARVTGGARPGLPAGFDQTVRDGGVIDTPAWKTVGRRTVSGVAPARPGVVGFDLRSDLLPPATESAGHDYVLLALVHHPADPFTLTAATTSPDAAVAANRQAAMAPVKVEAARGAAASGAANPPAGAPGAGAGGGAGGAGDASGAGGRSRDPGSPSVLVPAATALLAHKRLSDVVDGLTTKVNGSKVGVRVSAQAGGFERTSRASRTEYQVLALARRAQAMYRGGPPVPATAGSPVAGMGRFALLGALGFELPGNAALLAKGGRWVTEVMQRGTPDLHRSLVGVGTTELALSAGRLGVGRTTVDTEQARIRSFGMGMLAASAAGVVVHPQLADLLARQTNADWDPSRSSAGAAAVDNLIRQRLFGGASGGALAAWWPAVNEVPEALWQGYRTAIETELRLPGNRLKGFFEAERGLEEGSWLTDTRFANAYGLFRDQTATTSMHWTGWWGWLSLFTLASPLGLVVARALPHSRTIFQPGASAGERAWFEVLMSSMGMGSIGPFVASMYLWSQVDEHTDVFVESLVQFLVRAGLVAGALGTSGDESQKAAVRWLLFGFLASTDVYSAIRSIAAGGDPPGNRIVWAFQTNSAISGLLSFGVGAIIKAVVDEKGEEWPGWLVWLAHFLLSFCLAGMLGGWGLAGTGGWRSWFVRGGVRLSLLGRLGAGDPAEPRALAATFDDSSLWVDPQLSPPATPGPEHAAYPSGMRSLVVIWEDSGNLEVAHDASTVRFRLGGAQQTVTVPLTGLTAAQLATNLTGVVGNVHAEVVSVLDDDVPADPLYRLPRPETVNDPGDAGPLVDHAAASGTFRPVGADKEHGYLLRHAPRSELATRLGLNETSAAALDAFPVLPATGLGDLEATGLGHAGDLAVLLAMAAVPTLSGGPVDIPADEWAPSLGAGGQRVKEVSQVFRRWNLDERRANEWDQIVRGGAATEKGPNPAAADPLMRPYVEDPAHPGPRASPAPAGETSATAMGWVPLWRAWLSVATDQAADSEADVAMPYTPVVRLPDGTRRRLTNAELTGGVRFLLDLEA